MEPTVYNIEKTGKTPEIKGDMNTGELLIKGVSIPEDAKDFYFPLRNWVQEFILADTSKLNIKIELDYFNTSTSSVLLSLFKQFEQASKKKEVDLLWVYEEEDYEMEEVGKDYKLMVGDIMRLEMRPL